MAASLLVEGTNRIRPQLIQFGSADNRLAEITRHLNLLGRVGIRLFQFHAPISDADRDK